MPFRYVKKRDQRMAERRASRAMLLLQLFLITAGLVALIVGLALERHRHN